MKFLVLAILTLFLIPWTRKTLRTVDQKNAETIIKKKVAPILVIPIFLWIGIAIYEYF